MRIQHHVGRATDSNAEPGPMQFGPPENDEGRELGSDAAFREHATGNDRDPAELQADAQALGSDKPLSTLTARLALRGIELKSLPGGEFLAHSRGAFATLRDLHAVEAFARKVGAA